MSENNKEKIIETCKKLQKLRFITEIEEKKYSIKFLIRTDEEHEQENYNIRDRIKRNFEKQGYIVNILGTWWLEVIFIDINQMIDDCF